MENRYRTKIIIIIIIIIVIIDQTFYVDQPGYAKTRSSSPGADPITPGRELVLKSQVELTREMLGLIPVSPVLRPPRWSSG